MLFALAVLLITLLADSVHLDTDVVLTGEIGLTPFDRIEFGQLSIPRSFLYLGAVLLLNVGLTAAFWKELKVASFDPGLAAAIGMSPGVIGLGLVAATSLTAVTAFESVGSILVVALVVGAAGQRPAAHQAPPAHGHLVAFAQRQRQRHRLRRRLVLRHDHRRVHSLRHRDSIHRRGPWRHRGAA